jgi:hypothetical protein
MQEHWRLGSLASKLWFVVRYHLVSLVNSSSHCFVVSNNNLWDVTKNSLSSIITPYHLNIHTIDLGFLWLFSKSSNSFITIMHCCKHVNLSIVNPSHHQKNLSVIQQMNHFEIFIIYPFFVLPWRPMLLSPECSNWAYVAFLNSFNDCWVIKENYPLSKRISNLMFLASYQLILKCSQ